MPHFWADSNRLVRKHWEAHRMFNLVTLLKEVFQDLKQANLGLGRNYDFHPLPRVLESGKMMELSVDWSMRIQFGTVA